MLKWGISIAITMLLSTAALFYYITSAPNINSKKPVSVKIPTGSTFNDVLELLENKKALKNAWSFKWVVQLKKFEHKLKPGHYLLTPKLNNRQIANMLASGLQSPVKLVIYNIRTKEDFAGLIGRTLEVDSTKIINTLNDKSFCSQYSLDTANILSRFLVDNYELYWNTNSKRLFEKFELAYKAFWNEERISKAEELKLTPLQVTILASIVEKEVIFDKEMTTVAGVYLNRLKIGMPLQADPTLVFATRDFTTRRVTNYHKEFDTPYNTYKYAGLPPGPICMPRKKSIDAVLNAETHKYLYFCASPDMSGYSIFSRTYDEQLKVAAQYRKKLDAMKIK